ncbi:MAG: TaqI-like C-terminal specificity domain-containing protein, partial [Sphaerochaeta sp.]
MSDYVQQNQIVSSFQTSDSWVILSPIEASIKRKIEAVGTPLKDWNISINYGIKTGLNEAFIISTEKRNEILANCTDDDERRRTEELIRPILRGRDIKSYGYKWANLWLINTHNGIKDKIERIHIEDYPSVKNHLDKYWKKIEKRADQGDTPYNLRNCAYTDDFSKPKIMYSEIVQSPR